MNLLQIALKVAPQSLSANQEKTVVLRVSGVRVLCAYKADTFFSRLRGLFAYLPLKDDEALVISPCSAIHTFGMPHSIDVAFINSRGDVMATKTVPANRWCSVRGAVAVVETNAGVCLRHGIIKDTRLTRDNGDWS